MTRSLLPLTAILVLVGCEQQTEQQELNFDEIVAVEAAISNVQPLSAELPIEEPELEDMAFAAYDETRSLADCEIMGVLSGVWYDEALQPAFEGSWFELGTGELGGTIAGEYGEGDFVGAFEGTNLGDLQGSYDDGIFMGEWAEIGEDGTLLSDGQLIGRYERRNDYGGYFFGVWGQCG